MGEEIISPKNMDVSGAQISCGKPVKPRKRKPRKPIVKPTDDERNEFSPDSLLKLKVVVRQLPPTLPKAIFEEVTQTWNNPDSTAWSRFIPGKVYENLNKRPISSRAYIRFKDPDSLVTFHRAFNGHKFVDSKGVETIALVEFAPNLRAPKPRKPDNKQGTIESDPEYIDFLQQLKDEEEGIKKPVVDPSPALKVKDQRITPLIEFLRSRQAQKQERSKNRNKVFQDKNSELKQKGSISGKDSGKDKKENLPKSKAGKKAKDNGDEKKLPINKDTTGEEASKRIKRRNRKPKGEKGPFSISNGKPAVETLGAGENQASMPVIKILKNPKANFSQPNQTPKPESPIQGSKASQRKVFTIDNGRILSSLSSNNKNNSLSNNFSKSAVSPTFSRQAQPIIQRRPKPEPKT